MPHSWGLIQLSINQLQLYTEHTFAYRGHEVVWKDASPMTAAEIRQLDAHCRERFVELVPNQNSFGHMERWLKHPQYQHLAERPDGFGVSFGAPTAGGFSLCPIDPGSMAFLESLYDELLPHFTSNLFNVGCDEVLDIGLGRSKAEVDRRGRERVYLDFLLKIYDALKRRIRQMMFWGDIILHKPELLSELPRDIIALNWGYEADHPFETEARAFRDAGVPFYVCPGTSSWCSIGGRTDNALANLKNAAQHGLANGASGYLITDWGDYGHLQYLPTSFLPIAAGAAYAWCLESNRELPLCEALNLHVFQDPSGIVANVMHDLGNVANALKKPIKNGTPLFWTLIDEPTRRQRYEQVSAEEYANASDRVETAVSTLAKSSCAMQRRDGALIEREIQNTAAMLRHACMRGRWLRQAESVDRHDLSADLRKVVTEHRSLWLARNREGGLRDSIATLERVLDSYAL